MALASLFPKGFFDKKPEGPSTSSQSIASSSSSPLLPVDHEAPEVLPGRDKDGKFKLPPVAIYVSGAAFALTIGLTVLIVPYVRLAGRTTKIPPTFISHSNTSTTLRPGRIRPLKVDTASTPIGSAFSSRSSLTHQSKDTHFINEEEIPETSKRASSIAATQISDERADTPLLSMRRFNTSEERSLYGTSEADDKDDIARAEVSPLIGFYALGIATGIVGLSTGLGVWITARLMGVNSMDELAQRLREGLVKNMPVLAQTMDEAKEAEKRELGEASEKNVWDQWNRTILGDADTNEGKRQV